MSSTLPLYPYQDYPDDIVVVVHYADQFIPLIAMVYIFLLFILYCHQFVTRRNVWFTPSTIPLHRMAILSLLILFIYAFINYLLSNNYFNRLPFDCCSCITWIRLLFITFVFVKYSMVFCIILNLSYINQNPFVNPRYKYITKHSRLKLKRFFHILYIAVAIFFVIGLYGAWIHAASDQHTDSPHDFTYCTQTFTVYTFIFSFSGDMLGVILFSCLFGRNACEICRRTMKPHHGHKFEDGNLSDVGSYALGSNKINYDLDDPIRSKLGSENVRNIYSMNKKDADVPNVAKANTNVDTLILNIASADMEAGDGMIDIAKAKMNKDRSTVKKLKQMPLVKARELLSDEDWRGIAEQKRVLRLIWIIIIAYWISVLLFIFLGLLENMTCLTIMISATCIMLFNDYEFGSTYWKYRRCVCVIGACLCCVCKKMYCCNECFCGQEKLHKEHFEAVDRYKRISVNGVAKDDNNKFIRL